MQTTLAVAANDAAIRQTASIAERMLPPSLLLADELVVFRLDSHRPIRIGRLVRHVAQCRCRRKQEAHQYSLHGPLILQADMDRTRLASQLKQAEGIRKAAYRDSRGFWTGGVGHLLDQSKDWTGAVFTDEQIAAWLDEDMSIAGVDAANLLEWRSLDTDARQNALVELVFNMGLAHWRGFVHCRLGLCRQDWQLAHDQLLDSAWAKEVGPERSTRLANMFLQGEF